MNIDDHLVVLERMIAQAAHKPNDWANHPLIPGGIGSKINYAVNVALDLEENVPVWGKFDDQADAWMVVAVMQSLPMLIQHIRELQAKNANRTTTNSD